METLLDKIECLTRNKIDEMDLSKDYKYEFEFTHEDLLYTVIGSCLTSETRKGNTYLTDISFEVYKENKEIEQDELFELDIDDYRMVCKDIVRWYEGEEW